MKLTLTILLVCFTVASFGQSKKTEKVKPATEITKLHGYVVDQMCAKSMLKKSNPMERAAKHTKECALEEACAATGFGLLYGNGKWVKFDEKGDRIAKRLLEKSKKTNDLMFDVTGELKGDNLEVTSLTESAMSSDEMKQKKMHQEDVHHDHK